MQGESRALAQDEAAYIPRQIPHGVTTHGTDPVAVVNAYYPSRAGEPQWKDDIDAFLTPCDPRVDRAEHGYPSER
jgi:hypothetical protein